MRESHADWTRTSARAGGSPRSMGADAVMLGTRGATANGVEITRRHGSLTPIMMQTLPAPGKRQPRNPAGSAAPSSRERKVHSRNAGRCPQPAPYSLDCADGADSGDCPGAECTDRNAPISSPKRAILTIGLPPRHRCGSISSAVAAAWYANSCRRPPSRELHRSTLGLRQLM